MPIARLPRLRSVLPILLVVLVTVLGVRGYLQTGTPSAWDRGAAPSRVVFIPPKTGVAEIGRILAEAGVIQSAWAFLATAYLQGSLTRLHAGEYAFFPDMPLREVLRALEAGRVITHQVTIPEGFSLQDIARLLASERLADPEQILRLANDPAFTGALGIDAPSLEGYLFPDTYRLTRGMGEAEILRVMVGRFRRKLPPDVEERASAFDLDLHGIITLASLIEKEAMLERERTLVSAVFHNRLKRKMPLQSDPTAVYGVRQTSRRITAADLQRKNPYNTYLRTGLPPGPIANPGLASIRAAVNPAPVAYLYFVAKNDGSHVFSRTLAEHSRAVERYQRRPEGGGSRSQSARSGGGPGTR